MGVVTEGPFRNLASDAPLELADVLMVRLGHYIGSEIIERAPRVRFIVTATTGLDHVDLVAAAARGVRVLSLRDCMHLVQDVSATAELAWGLLLAVARRVRMASNHVLDGGWDRNLFWGNQLRGKRLGIIGHGRIGAMVAEYGVAFGMDVCAYDRNLDRIQPPVRPLPLNELLRTSDYVSIHVTASPDNRHLIDERRIGLLKPGSVLVNTARGSTADSKALAAAVVEGRLLGVAVDVLDGEERGRAGDDPLVACARAGHNVVITPHIGGATVEAVAQAEGAVLTVLEAELAQLNGLAPAASPSS
jgi:D-3-phosphoglycerate dehydrogenase / 2-oxoglutarate reductase